MEDAAVPVGLVRAFGDSASLAGDESRRDRPGLAGKRCGHAPADRLADALDGNPQGEAERHRRPDRRAHGRPAGGADGAEPHEPRGSREVESAGQRRSRRWQQACRDTNLVTGREAGVRHRNTHANAARRMLRREPFDGRNRECQALAAAEARLHEFDPTRYDCRAKLAIQHRCTIGFSRQLGRREAERKARDGAANRERGETPPPDDRQARPKRRRPEAQPKRRFVRQSEVERDTAAEEDGQPVEKPVLLGRQHGYQRSDQPHHAPPKQCAKNDAITPLPASSRGGGGPSLDRGPRRAPARDRQRIGTAGRAILRQPGNSSQPRPLGGDGWAPETFAHVSRKPTVRLKTGLPGRPSLSRQK